MATLYPPTTYAAATALGYLLDALGVDRHASPADDFPLPDLPGASLVRGHDTVMVTTDEPAPHGRVAMRTAAAERHLDIVLLRVEHDEDGAVTVSADLTLAALPHAPWSFTELSLWAGSEGDIWFVPAGFGPAVAVTSGGLTLELLPPYATSAERTVGVLRAGAEIACLLVKEAR
jgi:hypothetical protein